MKTFSFVIDFVEITCSMHNIEKINSNVKKNKKKNIIYMDLLTGSYSVQNISKENDTK